MPKKQTKKRSSIVHSKKKSVKRTGTLKTNKMNWKLALIVLIVATAIGGYFAYRSQVKAYAVQWTPDKFFLYEGGFGSGRIVTKNNGVKYWEASPNYVSTGSLAGNNVAPTQTARVIYDRPLYPEDREVAAFVPTATYCVDGAFLAKDYSSPTRVTFQISDIVSDTLDIPEASDALENGSGGNVISRQEVKGNTGGFRVCSGSVDINYVSEKTTRYLTVIVTGPGKAAIYNIYKGTDGQKSKYWQ